MTLNKLYRQARLADATTTNNDQFVFAEELCLIHFEFRDAVSLPYLLIKECRGWVEAKGWIAKGGGVRTGDIWDMNVVDEGF